MMAVDIVTHCDSGTSHFWKGRKVNMEYGDIIKPGIGAVIGFMLAQIVNFSSLLKRWWLRPKISINKINGKNLVLSHYEQIDVYQALNEDIYGFEIQNVGRSIATGVRFQLIKIETRGRRVPGFRVISKHAYDLSLYRGAGGKSKDTETVLVPGAAVTVELARWREDYGTVFPTVSGLPDYYEESCSGAVQYRFTVVAFDDNSRFEEIQLLTGNGK